MTPVFEGLSRKGADSPSAPESRPTSATPSVIGGGMELEGQLTARGDLRIEGRVKGSIRTQGEVVVAREGVVDGDIEAAEIHVGGRVSGTVIATGAARFMEGCRVDAEVRAPVVSIEEGGTVNGRLVMETRSSGGSSSSGSSAGGASSKSGSGSEKSSSGGSSSESGASGKSGGGKSS
ncbi:MAG: polymer-forming cytoskeletal protein [Candidatus Palauibacterales bacterium]|nr:polymer-forming cytoskeletal protein [Candidatus Palauibacterales bacterium]MDP2530230.1 polymer-forming cytoskeletal protein [Candidatus Palauibacterales bacterium]MDP2583015.1 polymer-forming cytoskeletal protein [Candidatus Palauibacterales bacterium]